MSASVPERFPVAGGLHAAPPLPRRDLAYFANPVARFPVTRRAVRPKPPPSFPYAVNRIGNEEPSLTVRKCISFLSVVAPSMSLFLVCLPILLCLPQALPFLGRLVHRYQA